MGGGAQNLTKIDAIFAGRGRGTTASHRRPVQGTAAAPHSPHATRDRGALAGAGPDEVRADHHDEEEGQTAGHDHDEETAPVVQDPSQTLPAALMKHKRRPHLTDPEEPVFRDSRGSARPTTDDGLPIYSVDELRIGQGLDTPECPFDCRCCF